MTRKDVEARLRDAQWPDPSAELCTRVVRGESKTLPAITWGDRVWYSRGWRWSTLAAVLVLLVLGQWTGGRPVIDTAPSSATLARIQGIEDVLRQTGLTTDEAAALAQRAAAWPQSRLTVAATLTFAGVQ